MGWIVDAVVSLMLANTVLDLVLEEWLEREVKPRMQGRGFLLRLADDGVIGGAREDDTRRMLVVLLQRFTCCQRTIAPPSSHSVAGP